jgi:cytoskeletal protein RodZ
MNEEERPLKALFQELKKEESRQAVPEQKDLLPKSRSIVWKVAVVVSGILLASYLFWWQQEQQVLPEAKMEWQTTESLIESPGGFDQWESPTDYLLESY